MEYSRSKVVRRYLKVIVLPLLLLLLLAFPSPVLAKDVTVRVHSPASAKVGNGFIAKVDIANVTNLDAVAFRVRFDPSILDLPIADADSNGIYDSIAGGVVGEKKVTIMATVQKEPGLIGIVAQVQPGLSGATGSGYLVELHFNALSPGTGNIGLEHYSLSNVSAESLAAEWTGASTVIVLTQEKPASTPVKSAPAKTQEVPASASSESAPTPTAFNWPLVGGISGAAVVVIVFVILIVRRRRD